MRIAVVTSLFPAHSEAFAAVEVRKLAELGHEVTVHSLRPMPPGARDDLAAHGLADVRVTWLERRSLAVATGTLVRHPLAVLRTLGWLVLHGVRTPVLLARALLLFPRLVEIAADVAADGADVVHLFWGHYPAAVGYLAPRLSRRPVVVSTFLGAYDLLYAFGPGIALAKSAAVVWTHADANVASLARLGIEPSRVHVLPRGVDRAQLPEDDAKIPRRIVTVARLVPVKGVDKVIRAVALVGARVPGCRLDVIGDGPEIASLRELARSLDVDVRFHGAVPHAEVFRALAQADVFVLASTNPSERLPNVVKEAMASRCVCVVTPTPGIEELVGVLDHPLVVAPVESELAAAIERVLVSPELFESDRLRGREHILRSFDAARVAGERCRVWAQALPAGDDAAPSSSKLVA